MEWEEILRLGGWKYINICIFVLIVRQVLAML